MAAAPRSAGELDLLGRVDLDQSLDAEQRARVEQQRKVVHARAGDEQHGVSAEGGGAGNLE